MKTKQKRTYIDLSKLGFMDCGENSWEYIDGDDFGDGGTEIWKDPKTGKSYEVEWVRVRDIESAEEV